MTPKTKCLEPATLAALAAGSMPSEAMRAVQKHLPECPRCLGIVAATVRERARVVGAAGMGDTVVIARPGKVRQSPVHLSAVLLSVLALGSSAAWWHRGAAGAPPPAEQVEERAALRAKPLATTTAPSQPATRFLHVGDAGSPEPDHAALSQVRSPRIEPIFEPTDVAEVQPTPNRTEAVGPMRPSRPSSDSREQRGKGHPGEAELDPQHVDIDGRRIRTTL